MKRHSHVSRVLLFCWLALASGCGRSQTSLPDEPRYRHVAQSSIDALFQGVDGIVIRETLAPDSRVLFQSSQRADIRSLQAALRVRPAVSTALCPCEPMPVIFLLAGTRTYASLAWEVDRFDIRSEAYRGYIELVDVSAALGWFDERGVPQARAEYLAAHAVPKASPAGLR